MAVLPVALRNKLERTIIEARDGAEAGAKAALEALAVHHHEPYGHMPPEERKLRNHLRARARQLGDKQNRKGELEITHLVWECAYEHWHRMLFARFLAENDLLIEPDMGVAINLEECEELAKDTAKDLWTLASEFAQRMLPQIFRPKDPVLLVTFASEHRLKLEKLLDDLEPSVFTASDSLGWVYQFWQSKRKKEVNQSGNKIGADELPTVTQLFTEPYMVSFLLDNSLGAWWVSKVAGIREQGVGKELRPGARRILRTAKSEGEIRRFFSLPGVPLEYLRFVKQESGIWTPAAGTFDGWPEHLSELKAIDPCSGSGHFLVAAFLMLAPMRMELEGLSTRETVDAVLRENLHGLEIDKRCVELAAFALAITAWTYPRAGGYRPLPELNVACSGLGISASKEEWLALAGDNTNLRMALEELHKQFKDAPMLGSLVNPEIGLAKGSLFEHKWEEIGPLLIRALSDEKDDEKTEIGIIAHGMARSATILSRKFDWVMTNVPYLGIRKQCDFIKDYCTKYHDFAKGDIATVFLDKYLKSNISNGGCYSVVTPSAIINKDYFKSLRKQILETYSIRSIALLGPRAFDTITGEVVDVILLTVSKIAPPKDSGFMFVDVFQGRTADEKANGIKSINTITLQQKEQILNPDFKIQPNSYKDETLLIDYCDCPQGIKTGDDEKWIRRFWELSHRNKWEFCQSSSKDKQEFGGLEKVIDWSTGGFGMIRPRLDSPAVGKWAIGLSQTGQKRPVLFIGARFDSNIAPVLPKESKYLLPIWTFCSSPEFIDRLEENSRGLFTTNTALLQVPFNFEHWTKIAQDKYPKGLPKPYSDDPTQWIFHGYPAQSTEPLQVAVARLLGYRWLAELESSMELSKEARMCVNKSKSLMSLPDKDGIFCIPSVRGEETADARLRSLLTVTLGPDWSPSAEQELISATGANASILDEWLRDHFFEQHCKLFHHRPFIWHIWDGRRRDGFHALVNYHKLAEGNGKGRQLLENLTYSYLGDWITRQNEGVRRGEGGAEDRLAAALELQKRLIAIIEGEPSFDIFVRWKPIEGQPIGWEPDISDGVRLNIRPFMAQDISGGRKGAGILRWKPNINWSKDRGKETFHTKEQYPWFWKDGEFTGDRINDVHLSIDEKSKTRGKT